MRKKKKRGREYNGGWRESANNMIGIGLQREEARKHKEDSR